MVFTYICVRILVKTKLKWEKKYHCTASWLLVTGILQFGFCSCIYYLFTHSRDLSSRGRWSYACRALSSVSLLLKLLLSVLKQFIPALLHLLLSPSSIHLKVIKILLSTYIVYCSHSKISHWFLRPLSEAWNEWKRKEKLNWWFIQERKL